MPELESDRPKKIWEVGALDRSETQKSDGSASNNAEEDNPVSVEHGAQLEQSTCQIQQSDDRVPSQLSDGYGEANVVFEDVNKQ